MPAWRECTIGSIEDRLLKLSDPERRPELRKVEQSGLITNNVADIFVLECQRSEPEEVRKSENRRNRANGNKHPVDAMLDIATADGLNTEFYTPPINVRVDHMSEMIHSDAMAIFGVSDGGAHTKFFTGGRYPTETLIKFVRDNPVMSLEEAHFRLSAHPAMCAGFKNRGNLVEGAAADVVVYDLARLKIRADGDRTRLPGRRVAPGPTRRRLPRNSGQRRSDLRGGRLHRRHAGSPPAARRGAKIEDRFAVLIRVNPRWRRSTDTGRYAG